MNKNQYINAGLAALAAGVGSFAYAISTSNATSVAALKSAAAAAAYGALRLAAGVLASAFGKPVPVDQPSA